MTIPPPPPTKGPSTFDRRGARAQAQGTPPCWFNLRSSAQPPTETKDKENQNNHAIG